MGKIKDWMMDLDASIEEAYFLGCTTYEIIEHVKKKVHLVDESYIREKIKEYDNG